MLNAIVAGLTLGSVQAALMAGFFVVTRAHRRRRNRLVIYSGYAIIMALMIAPLMLLPFLLQRDAAFYAFLTTFGCGEVLVIRAELRWRKSWQTRQPSVP